MKNFKTIISLLMSIFILLFAFNSFASENNNISKHDIV